MLPQCHGMGNVGLAFYHAVEITPPQRRGGHQAATRVAALGEVGRQRHVLLRAGNASAKHMRQGNFTQGIGVRHAGGGGKKMNDGPPRLPPLHLASFSHKRVQHAFLHGIQPRDVVRATQCLGGYYIGQGTTVVCRSRTR